jgi:preprotein translocase subunit SecE
VQNFLEMKKIIVSLKASYDELVHKVSWPTTSELSSSAVVVLFASLLMALVVFGIDIVFEHFMKLIYTGKF